MYPCPYCLSPAALDTGCTGCHRPPDPEAAEVIRLDGTIRVLAAEVDSTRRAHAAARERYEAVRLERNALAARVHARVRASMTPAGPVPSAPLAAEPALAVDPASPPREASTRTVQNVLFVLGGLLLGSAAIVFTAVA